MDGYSVSNFVVGEGFFTLPAC